MDSGLDACASPRNDKPLCDAKVHASSADFARRANLSRSAAIDLTPKSVASLACLVPEKRGGSRSSRTLGTGCDGRGSVRRANSARTNDVAADGEVVWSWRSDAGAKVVKTLSRLTGDGGNQAWSPRRARRTPLKPLRREGRMIRLYLWFCRVLFVARGPWVRAGTRPSLRPLVFEGQGSCKARAQCAARMRVHVLLRCRAPLHAGHPVRRGLSA